MIPSAQVLDWFKDGKQAGKELLLVELRRTDRDACDCLSSVKSQSLTTVRTLYCFSPCQASRVT